MFASCSRPKDHERNQEQCSPHIKQVLWSTSLWEDNLVLGPPDKDSRHHQRNDVHHLHICKGISHRSCEFNRILLLDIWLCVRLVSILLDFLVGSFLILFLHLLDLSESHVLNLDVGESMHNSSFSNQWEKQHSSYIGC